MVQFALVQLSRPDRQIHLSSASHSSKNNMKRYLVSFILLCALSCYGLTELQKKIILMTSSDVAPWLEDTFATPLPAGSLNNTAADGRTPSQIRTVIDTGNKVSISNGKLSINGGTATGDPSLRYPSISRSAGTCIMFDVSRTGTGPYFGFTALSTGVPADDAFYAASSALNVRTASGSISVGSATLFSPNFTVTMRSAGSWLFQGAGTSRKLMYVLQRTSDSTVYPSIVNASAVATCDYVFIPSQKYLVTPLSSSSFASAFGSTDGLGHLEQNGGSGLTWTTTGTWATGTNAAYSTTTGTNIATTATSSPDVLVDANWVRDSSTNCFGVIARCDNAANPQNYIGLMHSNSTVYLYKVESGISANLATTASMTYSAGATLRLMVDGTEVRGFYNNAACGNTTVGTALTNYNNHGIVSFSVYPKATNNVVWARGTSGEYAGIDTLK